MLLLGSGNIVRSENWLSCRCWLGCSNRSCLQVTLLMLFSSGLKAHPCRTFSELLSITPLITGQIGPTCHITQPQQSNLVRSDLLQFVELADAAESDIVCLCKPQEHQLFSIIAVCLLPGMLLEASFLTRFIADYSLSNQSSGCWIQMSTLARPLASNSLEQPDGGSWLRGFRPRNDTCDELSISGPRGQGSLTGDYGRRISGTSMDADIQVAANLIATYLPGGRGVSE